MLSVSTTTTGISQILPTQSTINKLLSTPCSATTTEEQNGNDWLHRDMTYKRKSRDADHISHVSSTDGMQGQQENFTPTRYIYGPSKEFTDIHTDTYSFLERLDILVNMHM